MFDLDQRAAGVLLHVTSLPGPHGIGDFGPDAFRFVDWLSGAGQTLWQWLPVNPIGPGNSPYQSVSAFAGSPLMIALEDLVAKGWLAAPTLPEGGFDAHRVDFGRVVAWRNARLREAYAGFVAKHDPGEHAALAAWAEAEAYWLEDYALFMALETAHGGQPWWTWAPALRDREPAALAAARREHAAEIGYWTWVQWCFDTQATALKRYANGRGIAIMGDLPIYIAHHSADCWARPDLYQLDPQGQPTAVAGCPVRAGEHVMVMLGAGNTDEAEFPHADEIRWDRDGNRHLVFGGGIHRCLGSNLARLELRVVLREWHERLPNYRIAPGAELLFSPGVRSVDRFPMVLDR